MSDARQVTAKLVAPGLRPHEEGPALAPPPDGEGYPTLIPEPVPAPAPRGPLDQDAQADAVAAADNKLRRESYQFSLSGLFLVVTLLSVLLGPIVWLPLPVFAGLIGLATLVLLVLISIFNTRRAIVRLAWWLMVGLYLAAATAAYIHS